ncbi:hypothetical protein F441_09171 [Phytophthora nicotianae CJ01A1]|uniref:Uncharacterized protein n=3 Tax=Phytophthora nicotianae TaxID=4792 RepID=W2GTH8_PHYNI|nr:hypothetical protein L915_09037 [Phytophthora nicotianae]ETL92855.1 hypothetical protein L917_08884 [Phytophthora nicotianae]ETO75059.1 hypothetical protein F444_09293 [Phytophthora nicotianae P1976]ETP16187.1 hypothetical protein F441_09171 [Phytophthora nicotianae CJ01A1]
MADGHTAPATTYNFPPVCTLASGFKSVERRHRRLLQLLERPFSLLVVVADPPPE